MTAASTSLARATQRGSRVRSGSPPPNLTQQAQPANRRPHPNPHIIRGARADLDLITRLEPLIHELLSYEEPILVISHQAVLRVLRAYLLHKPRERCFTENIPQHAVMRITWDGWHFPPTPSPREAEMKTRWPPPDSEAWNPATAVPPGDEAIGTEEWVWLGPDTKKSDGQTNL
jgi:broad specificity phosphatase PhoE